MKLSRVFTLCAGAALATLISHSASATSMQQQSLKEMVQASEAGVIADLVSVKYETVGRKTYTLSTFKTVNVAFGDVGSTVTVRTNGGVNSNTKFQVVETSPGAPRFFGGTQYFLLLDELPDTRAYAITNTLQGVVPVLNNSLRLPQTTESLNVDEALAEILVLRDAALGDVKE